MVSSDLESLKADVPTLLGLGLALSMLSALICLVLKIFARARFARPRRYADARINPPLTVSGESVLSSSSFKGVYLWPLTPFSIHHCLLIFTPSCLYSLFTFLFFLSLPFPTGFHPLVFSLHSIRLFFIQFSLPSLFELLLIFFLHLLPILLLLSSFIFLFSLFSPFQQAFLPFSPFIFSTFTNFSFYTHPFVNALASSFHPLSVVPLSLTSFFFLSSPFPTLFIFFFSLASKPFLCLLIFLRCFLWCFC